MKDEIPKKTVYRLTLYNRCLDRLGKDVGPTVSSDALAKVAGVKPTQLRKDLACCGPIGKRGFGYDVELLRRRLRSALRKTRLRPVVLIGAGNLGAALLRYDGFGREGFEIVGAFDLRPGQSREQLSVPILPMSVLPETLEQKQVRMAILCVPAMVAQEVCNQLVSCGVQAILNFAPIILQVPEHVAVNNVNLAIELESLSYFIR